MSWCCRQSSGVLNEHVPQQHGAGLALGACHPKKNVHVFAMLHISHVHTTGRGAGGVDAAA